MKKFEIGKEYFDRSACNHDCIFTIKIIKRTEKTVTFERNGKTRRAKLFFDERGEYIIPERYSMAPVFRAENEVQPEEEPSVEEAAETSCGVEIVQPADANTVVVMVGQRVERICGACYPPQGGTVIGFVIPGLSPAGSGSNSAPLPAPPNADIKAPCLYQRPR